MFKPPGEMSVCKPCPFPGRVEVLRRALKLACWVIENKLQVPEFKDKSMVRHFYDRALKDSKKEAENG